jgi:hypothetical protein
MPNFAKGARVEVFGLKNATQLNGKYGTLLGFQKKVGRWRVRCDIITPGSGKRRLVAVKPENLVMVQVCFDSDQEDVLRQRLLKETAEMEQAKETLRLAQQHFNQTERAVQHAQAELDKCDVEGGAKSRVLFDCQNTIVDIFGFLSVRDLGNAARTCKTWGNSLEQENDLLWKSIALRKWPAIPEVVENFRSFCKSQAQKTLPKPVLVYPHYNNNKDDEEYYLIVEFPHLKQETSRGAQMIMKSFKLDETLITEEGQNIFEQPICDCDEWRCDDMLHRNSLVRLPMDVKSLPFDPRRLMPKVTFKLSILRSSDCKIANLMDPYSIGWDTMASNDDHVEDICSMFCHQSLRDIPTFDSGDHEGETSIGFQVDAAISPCEHSQEIFIPEVGESTSCLSRSESGDGYSLTIDFVIVGFTFHQQNNDKHHMAPPFQSACMTEFLDMAGVVWR